VSERSEIVCHASDAYHPNVPLDNDGLIPLRALANPLRLRIVSLLIGTAMSATEVAEELDIAHASASYHLRQLAAAGFLERVEDVKDPAIPARRGRARLLYRYDLASAQRMDISNGQDLLYEATFTDLRRRLPLMTRQRSTTDAEVWVGREEWEQACDLVNQAIKIIHEKAGQPRAEGAVHVSMTAFMFEMDDGV
jgi:DNA-binding transcriptional ArsR family regulator